MHHPTRRRPAVAGALLVAALVAGGSAACRHLAAAPPADGRATVVDVVDGDTIDVRIAGRDERVRLIGIDTPETVDPDRPVGCYGPEASARTKDLLPAGTAVRLERDVEARDRYGRLLAYVYRSEDGLFVNLSLAVDGYADALVIEPDTAHAGDIGAAVADARAAGRGMWGACPDL